MVKVNPEPRRDAQTDEEKAQHSLFVALESLAAMYGRGSFEYEQHAAASLGKNILREEIGFFHDPLLTLQPYDFGAETKDKLLAHGRQDTAAIHSMTVVIMRKCFDLERDVRRLKWMVGAVCLFFGATILFQVLRVD